MVYILETNPLIWLGSAYGVNCPHFVLNYLFVMATQPESLLLKGSITLSK